MTGNGVVRYAPHALVATTAFEFAHIGDEFAGNWAPFTPILDPTVAAISLGLFVLVSLWGLWWILADRPWGYAVAGCFGLFFLTVEMWHYFDPSNMTPFRWAILWLAQLGAAILVVICLQALRAHRPWQRTESPPAGTPGGVADRG